MTKNNSIVESVKKLVKKRYKENHREDEFKHHLYIVVKYSIEFANRFDADPEICELASLLHDIKKIKGNGKSHHIAGRNEAKKILRGLGYPNEGISQIGHCIITHSCDSRYPPLTIEARVVSAADAFCHFNNFPRVCRAIYQDRGFDEEKARNWLIHRYESLLGKILIPELREEILPKYKAIQELFGRGIL
jgi:hypothetical protein